MTRSKNLLPCLIFAIILASCSGSSSVTDDSNPNRIVKKIVSQNIQQLNKEGFELCAIGDMGPITLRGLIARFETSNPKYRFKSREEARIFFVEKVEEYAKPFNEEKKIRLIMHNFPFTDKNINLDFRFLNNDKTPLQPPLICDIANKDGKIFYKMWNEKDKTLETIYVEQYVDALRIYKEFKAKNK